MRAFVGFLYQQASQDAQLAATLTLIESPNLMVVLDQVSATGDPAATIDLATDLFRLLQPLGKPRLLEKIGAVRDAAAKLLSHSFSQSNIFDWHCQDADGSSGGIPPRQRHRHLEFLFFIVL
jgi:hypothetical protein